LTLLCPDAIAYDFIPSFIRGFVEGDGSSYQRHRVAPNTSWTETTCKFTSGSVLFLDSLERELQKYGIRIRKRYRNQSSNAHVLPLSGTIENLSKFANLIYKDCTVCLDRKR